MAFYITNAVYNKCLFNMELDVPFLYAKQYYQGSKIEHFDIDLRLLPLYYARMLVISDKLVKDITILSTNILIRKTKESQKKWVYKVVSPAYHSDDDCEFLSRDFVNVLIPPSLDSDRKDEYREYFLKYSEEYGFIENKKDPRIFCRKAKEHFSLSETVNELVEKYFSKVRLDNSGIFDDEAIVKKINEDINAYNDMWGKTDPELFEKYYHDYKRRLLSVRDYEHFDLCFRRAKEIVREILAFHFRNISKSGMDVSEKFLQMSGLRPCKHCCSHRAVDIDEHINSLSF